MIRRTRIVQCRLSDDEFKQFAPLVGHTFDRTWSDLLRRGLLRLWKDEIGEQSDNGVIQNGRKKKQRPVRPAVVPKRYRPCLPAAKSKGI